MKRKCLDLLNTNNKREKIDFEIHNIPSFIRNEIFFRLFEEWANEIQEKKCQQPLPFMIQIRTCFYSDSPPWKNFNFNSPSLLKFDEKMASIGDLFRYFPCKNYQILWYEKFICNFETTINMDRGVIRSPTLLRLILRFISTKGNYSLNYIALEEPEWQKTLLYYATVNENIFLWRLLLDYKYQLDGALWKIMKNIEKKILEKINNINDYCAFAEYEIEVEPFTYTKAQIILLNIRNFEEHKYLANSHTIWFDIKLRQLFTNRGLNYDLWRLPIKFAIKQNNGIVRLNEGFVGVLSILT